MHRWQYSTHSEFQIRSLAPPPRSARPRPPSIILDIRFPSLAAFLPLPVRRLALREQSEQGRFLGSNRVTLGYLLQLPNCHVLELFDQLSRQYPPRVDAVSLILENRKWTSYSSLTLRSRRGEAAPTFARCNRMDSIELEESVPSEILI